MTGEIKMYKFDSGSHVTIICGDAVVTFWKEPKAIAMSPTGSDVFMRTLQPAEIELLLWVLSESEEK